MKTIAIAFLLTGLAACSTTPTAPPKPDANGEVTVSCSSSGGVITVGDCEAKAKQACGGGAHELSRNTGPRLGGDVDIYMRYRCTGP